LRSREQMESEDTSANVFMPGLAIHPPPHDSGWPEGAGYVGLITANSFMKREFGKKFSEQWVACQRPDPISGHKRGIDSGTRHPTVILIGRKPQPSWIDGPSGDGNPGRAVAFS